MKKITPKTFEKIRGNKKIRQVLGYRHPLFFSLLYLHNHFSHPLAPFHLEMFHLIKESKYKLAVVMAFRESGKSTILNMANVLWSILGEPKKKFVIIISKTQEQAKTHFTNIKNEIANNELLKKDFGPFTENREDQKKLSLELVYHESKIMCVTREQSIRGIKHDKHRPDLIICDDLEDSNTKSWKSGALYRRFNNEIIPVGSDNTKIVTLGNFIFKESLIMKLRRDINRGEKEGIFRIYPLIDSNGKALWNSRFSNFSAIEKLLKKSPEETWDNEYLLNTTGYLGYHEQVTSLYTEIKFKNDPFSLKLNLAELSKEAEQRIAEIDLGYIEKLGTKIQQSPLIRQMERFVISAPSNSIFIPEKDDFGYKFYQEYRNEIKEVREDYDKKLKKNYENWIKENAKKASALA